MTSIVSNENKEMLWELIIDICNDNSFKVNGDDLKNFLDGRCGYYHGQRFEFENYDMNLINKEIIGQCYNYILSNQSRLSNNQPGNTEKRTNKLKRENNFEEILAVKEKNFKDSINLKKPKEIDFSDGSDEFPIGDLDKIMNQTLEDRQRELQQITSKFSTKEQEEATKWLNNGENPKIKIFDNISQNEVIIPQKKVRFEIKDRKLKKPSEVMNFLSKLKVKNEDNDIISKIDKIISNQEIIIKLLKKNKEDEVDESDEIPSYEAI